MADGGPKIPDTGQVPPAATPQHAPPASPQAASYDDPNPPEPVTSPRSWWPLCLLVGAAGCGCLLIVLLAFGLISGVSWTLFGGEEPAPVNVIDRGGMEIGSPAAQPGPEAAMTWAYNRQPQWKTAIDESSDDWMWVRLLMGPADGNLTTWVEIEWDAAARRYSLLDEGPIGVDGAQGDIPEIYQPGEEVAREAALSYVEQPDWVARVDSHSDDWTRATVSVGPPASEFLYVATLQWDDELDVYELLSLDDVDYPGME